MARNKNGGFNKVLNFIGLVDDEDPRDNYTDEYESGAYGRPSTYVPRRTSRPAPERSRQELTPRRAGGYAPTRTPRMDRSAGYTGRYDDRAPSRRSSQTSSAQFERVDEDRGRYDYSPRPAARTSSRFGGYEDDAGASQRMPVPQQGGRARPSRQRTVMFSLHSLEDCCDVIDNLILNNTVILTLDDLEPRLMQRAVDTLSGAVFALHATIRKASERTYLIAPMTVEVNETYDMDRRF